MKKYQPEPTIEESIEVFKILELTDKEKIVLNALMEGGKSARELTKLLDGKGKEDWIIGNGAIGRTAHKFYDCLVKLYPKKYNGYEFELYQDGKNFWSALICIWQTQETKGEDFIFHLKENIKEAYKMKEKEAIEESQKKTEERKKWLESIKVNKK